MFSAATKALEVRDIDLWLHVAERSGGWANGTRRSSPTTRMGPSQPMEDMFEE
jgi:hypothetical protein